MRKWTVYILLAVCLSGCGRGNGNKQGGFSIGTTADNISVKTIEQGKLSDLVVPDSAMLCTIKGDAKLDTSNLQVAKDFMNKEKIASCSDTTYNYLGVAKSKLGDDEEAIINYSNEGKEKSE